MRRKTKMADDVPTCKICDEPIRERTEDDPTVQWNSPHKWVHVEDEEKKEHYAHPERDKDPPPGPRTPPSFYSKHQKVG